MLGLGRTVRVETCIGSGSWIGVIGCPRTAGRGASTRCVSARRILKAAAVTGDILNGDAETLQPSAPDDASLSSPLATRRSAASSAKDRKYPVRSSSSAARSSAGHRRDNDRWWLAPEELFVIVRGRSAWVVEFSRDGPHHRQLQFRGVFRCRRMSDTTTTATRTKTTETTINSCTKSPESGVTGFAPLRTTG